MKNIIVTNALVQYAFLNQVNPTSGKFTFDAIIPQSHPQINDIMQIIGEEWAAVAQGAEMNDITCQSKHARWVTKATGGQSLHPDTLQYLDDNMNYLIIRGFQPGNTTNNVGIFDSRSQPVANRKIIGEGTVANISLTFSGYFNQDVKKKGIHVYGQWIQIVHLVENKYANTNYGPTPIEGGYVASADMVAIPGQEVQSASQASPAAGTVPGMPVVDTPASGYAAPTMPSMPAPQAAPQAAPGIPTMPSIPTAPGMPTPL